MTPPALLEVQNVNVHYGDLQAIRNASLDIPPGRIVSIIGANGAGKSTLLKAIVGALIPSSGEIWFKGRKLNGLKPYQTLTCGLSLVPEEHRIFSRLTVFENLLIGAYTSKAREKRHKTLSSVYDLFPILAERANQLGTNLSGGEQQMLSIARALMYGPRTYSV